MRLLFLEYNLQFLKSKKIYNEVLFWGLLILCFAVIQFFKDGNDQLLYVIFLQNFKRIPAMIFTAYLFNDVLLPRFYFRKKYIIFGVLTLLLFYIASALDRVINVYIYEPLFREGSFEQESIAVIFRDVHFLFFGYLSPLLMATFTMTFDRVVTQKNTIARKNIQLERDKNKAELGALKAQIHPHFLFNTLNNLYALTLQKSDKAPETVATLSSMLDYMLYQCNDKLVSLDKEIELLENYIELEQLRYGDEIEITFKKEIQEPLQIAPLILLSIVENAFKHGASGSIDTPKIHIDIRQEDAILYFKVKNTKNNIQQVDETAYTKGIGVSNIKKQLSFLYLDYSYEVLNTGGWYCVDLCIDTSKVND